MRLDLKVINKHDPLKREVERQNEKDELSPMEPPEAFNPPSLEKVDFEDMHPAIQSLMTQHRVGESKIDGFEIVLAKIHEEGFTKSSLEGINDFFSFFDDSIIEHNRVEDATVFALLNTVLYEKEEYSTGTEKTVVDLMEDDHRKMLQLAAVSFNLFGLITRISDHNSALIILDLAVEQSKSLVEILKLHIFREDNVVFPMVNTYLSTEVLDGLVSIAK